MATQLQAESKVRIHVPRVRVWDAIVNPKIVKQYFYEANLEADWRVGGEVTYSGFWNGQAYEDKGTITEFEEGYSVTMDFPEKYGKVTWTLIDQSEPNILNISIHDFTTILTVTQSGVESEKERKASEESWDDVLHKMKDILEC